MAVVKHPRVPNVSVEVPDEDAERWAASGWVADRPIEDELPDGAEFDALPEAHEGDPEAVSEPAKPRRSKK